MQMLFREQCRQIFYILIAYSIVTWKPKTYEERGDLLRASNLSNGAAMTYPDRLSGLTINIQPVSIRFFHFEDGGSSERR